MATFFEDIKEYVGFDERDAAVLRELHPLAAPHYDGFAEHFYEAIERHPGVRSAITGGQAQIHRLKHTLTDWMASALQGPHDEAFYERRARIGRMHVRISLPQQYMFTAMNLVRIDFGRLIEQVHRHDPERRCRALESVNRLFDLELAIMLHTYAEDSADRLRRKERLATIGQIAGSIGHELRNPLGVIQSSVFILHGRSDDPRISRHLQRIDQQVELCNAIISNLLEIARSQRPPRDELDLAAIIGQAVDQAAPPASVDVVVELAPEVHIVGDPTLLQQAIANLVRNSIQALESREGRVTVSVRRQAEEILIEVADDGPGFGSDDLGRIFEPLVSGRNGGIGLGLALVKGVAERHAGVAEAENRPGGGAVVRLRLPHPAQPEQPR